MISAIGLVVLFVCVFGGFIMAGGSMAPIIKAAPIETFIIVGAAISAMLVGNSMEIFKGAVDDLTISVQGGLQLGAVLTNDGQAESDLHEGERVFARIQPEDIHIVAA